MEISEAVLEELRSIHSDLKTISDRDQNCMDMLRERVKELRMIVTGYDGSNGLRSHVKVHEKEIEMLKRWQTQFMAVFAVVQLIGVPVAIYLITRFIK